MNIYEKLIEVRKKVPYLKKDNKGFQFVYVSSSQTIGALRKELDAQGLLLVPQVIETKVGDHTTLKDKHEYFTQLKMTFTWVNAEKPEEKIECQWYGQGLDDGEKGVGKALTYAEKYFLLKFFNIATDKDDPDENQGEPSTTTTKKPSKPDKPKPQTTSGTGATDKQIKAIYSIGSGNYDFSDDTTKEVCEAVLGKTIQSFKDLTIPEASKCIEAFNDKEAINAIVELDLQKTPDDKGRDDANNEPEPDEKDDLPF